VVTEVEVEVEVWAGILVSRAVKVSLHMVMMVVMMVMRD
jgi:hypothetical protein